MSRVTDFAGFAGKIVLSALLFVGCGTAILVMPGLLFWAVETLTGPKIPFTPETCIAFWLLLVFGERLFAVIRIIHGKGD